MDFDFVYTMQHPTKMIKTFTNSPYIAESYSRAGWNVTARSNTGNGSKVFKFVPSTRI